MSGRPAGGATGGTMGAREGAAGAAITGAGAGVGGGGGGGGGAGTGARAGAGVRTSAGPGAAAPSVLTAKTLLHTLQRARTPPAGTLAGSTRYTVSHDGQVTFTRSLYSPLPGSPGSGSWRRSTTNTDPACVFA
jgi:hypothetical protein